MEFAHPDSSPQFSTGARIFLNLFQNLTAVIHLVVVDVSRCLTLLILKICRLKSLKGSYKDLYKSMFVCTCVSASVLS